MCEQWDTYIQIESIRFWINASHMLILTFISYIFVNFLFAYFLWLMCKWFMNYLTSSYSRKNGKKNISE